MKIVNMVDRFKCLVKGNPHPRPTAPTPRSTCLKILEELESSVDAGFPIKESFQMGTSRIFMREALELTMEEARAKKLFLSAVAIQARFRGYLVRCVRIVVNCFLN